ncbi:MAG: hypothetical protein Q7R41_07710 [Phycisphaerales bacterium]|nr:hypothetical protein [Phycisphaerales bacterium]
MLAAQLQQAAPAALQQAVLVLRKPRAGMAEPASALVPQAVVRAVALVLLAPLRVITALLAQPQLEAPEAKAMGPRAAQAAPQTAALEETGRSIRRPLIARKQVPVVAAAAGAQEGSRPMAHREVPQESMEQAAREEEEAAKGALKVLAARAATVLQDGTASLS